MPAQQICIAELLVIPVVLSMQSQHPTGTWQEVSDVLLMVSQLQSLRVKTFFWPVTDATSMQAQQHQAQQPQQVKIRLQRRDCFAYLAESMLTGMACADDVILKVWDHVCQ